MSSSELQALFSNLKPRAKDRSSASPAPSNPAASRQASSALFSSSQLPSTPPPPFAAIATNGTAQDRATPNTSTAQHLLNLLNYNNAQGSGSLRKEKSPTPQDSNDQPLSASDLVAKFMIPRAANTSSTALEAPKQSTTDAPGQSIPQPPSNPLLELLNKRISTGAQPEVASEGLSQSVQADVNDVGPNTIVESIETPSSPVRSNALPEPMVFASPAPATPGASDSTPKPLFTYQNPFEALQASRSSRPADPAVATPLPITPSFDFAATTPTDISARKKLTPKLRSQRSGLSPQVDSNLPDHRAGEAEKVVEPDNLPIRDKLSLSDIQEAPAKDAALPEPKNADEAMDQKLTADFGKEMDEGSGEWEDIPDKANPTSGDSRVVPVYNFPIKAFVSITMQLDKPSDVGLRDDGIMEISRLKKEFDQLDRSLAAATSRYITYALIKSGGMRIIRQDDGSDRHVFKGTHDRIFNVAFCTTAIGAAATDHQAVLGTGISGNVYYATVSKVANDLFELNQLDSESLILPPWPQGDDNTAGGVLKTRAKRSSRHIEFFAIGRGKSIHLIWPATAMTPRYGISGTNRVLDIEKFYEDHPLLISTGKAGKDFIFSEDDTMIVSLDKTGRLRFWDIRTLVDEANATAARIDPIIVDTPTLSLATASPAEKSWPTSVLFVDKARPYNKGGAQRYVLVGLRQNHTLQLWDIALGKAVQEINFPHESETDGICSVNYHPGSGIIVVGHPTRNSIFFIHLSAPRYSLSSSLTQAEYVSKIAAKSNELPKPESTACMSGIRELSFGSKGELRSVELLPVLKESSADAEDSSAVFELYIMHSKGVTCLGINKADLGWNSESKVIKSADALASGLVVVKDLKLGAVIEEPGPNKSPVLEPQPSTKASKKKAKKASAQPEEIISTQEESQPNRQVEVTNVPAEPTDAQMVDVPVSAPAIISSKEAKKAKKKAAQATQASEQAPIDEVKATTLPNVVEPESNSRHLSNSGKAAASEVIDTNALAERLATGLTEEVKKIESVVSDNLKTQLDTLYQHIQSDRSTQDQISNSRQETILRLVSDSLNNNVEKSLTRIVSQQIQQNVIPIVAQSASAETASSLSRSLHEMIPQELGKHLPDALSIALQNAHNVRTISDAITNKLNQQLSSKITEIFAKTVAPAFTQLANDVADRAAASTEQRLSDRIQHLEVQHAVDNEKIDKLSQVLKGMAGTLQAMSDSQVAFQNQILKERREMSTAASSSVASTSRQVSTIRASPTPTPIAQPKLVKAKTNEELELEDVARLMNAGQYEEATIKWLQSPQSSELFDEVFIRFTPDYLTTDVSPLVAFSVAVTVGYSLASNLERRLEWISTAFGSIDAMDSELVDLAQHAPALISSLIQKLESLYMNLAEHNPGNVSLRSIPQLVKKARDMRAAFLVAGGAA